MDSELRESQMPLPPLLRELMACGRWRQPADAVIFAAVPFLREPVDFLLSEAAMRRESNGQCVGLPHFREYRGSDGEARALPWLDDDRALFIAVNREPGADIAIVLDYRRSLTDPRVVASDWWSDNNASIYWREVTETFAEFVRKLAL
jgi:hypothetical protein